MAKARFVCLLGLCSASLGTAQQTDPQGTALRTGASKAASERQAALKPKPQRPPPPPPPVEKNAPSRQLNPQLRTGAAGPLGGIAAGTFSRACTWLETDAQEPEPDKTSCPSAARNADKSCRLLEALTRSGRRRPPEVQAITSRFVVFAQKGLMRLVRDRIVCNEATVHAFRPYNK